MWLKTSTKVPIDPILLGLITPITLEIDTLISQKLVIIVVLDFGHVSCDVDVFQKFRRKVPAR